MWKYRRGVGGYGTEGTVGRLYGTVRGYGGDIGLMLGCVGYGAIGSWGAIEDIEDIWGYREMWGNSGVIGGYGAIGFWGAVGGYRVAVGGYLGI